MRSFTVSWEPAATLDLLHARAFLGVVRAEELDAELEVLHARLAALPESGAPVKMRHTWRQDVRRVILSRTPYHVYYRVNLMRERVVIVAVRHERARPLPRL